METIKSQWHIWYNTIRFIQESISEIAEVIVFEFIITESSF